MLQPCHIPDFLDVQTIMKEGKIQELSKCIQNVLNYDLNSLTNNSRIRVLDPSFITLFQVGQFIIKFLLFWKMRLFKENHELRVQLQVCEILSLNTGKKNLVAGNDSGSFYRSKRNYAKITF